MFREQDQQTRNSAPSETTPVAAAGRMGIFHQDAGLLEAQLVRRVAQGDREAFGELYDRYSMPLYSIAVGILDDPRAAEDVVQEVFLQIREDAPPSDEAQVPHFSWALTMTRNKVMERLRARQLKSAPSAPDEPRVVPAGGLDGRFTQETVSLSPSSRLLRTGIVRDSAAVRARAGRKSDVFGDLAISAFVATTTGPTHRGRSMASVEVEQVAQLREALNELPSEQRRPIELAFFGGLTHIEIAEVLGEPVNIIQARMGSGMLGLRARLEGGI